MFGSKKINDVDNSVSDETIGDKSKFVVFGFTVLIASILLFIILEIFTSVKISSQKNMLKMSGSVQKESDKILMDIGELGKKSEEIEYQYIKEIMKFMSPKEFQEFKNGISGIASSLNVQINSLNEIEKERLSIYHIYAIEYEFLSEYENFVKLKNKLSKTNFKINLLKETITRENPYSMKIIASGIINAYVFEEKIKTLEAKKKLIEKYQAIEEKKQQEKTEG